MNFSARSTPGVSLVLKRPLDAGSASSHPHIPRRKHIVIGTTLALMSTLENLHSRPSPFTSAVIPLDDTACDSDDQNPTCRILNDNFIKHLPPQLSLKPGILHVQRNINRRRSAPVFDLRAIAFGERESTRAHPGGREVLVQQIWSSKA